ncbi:hypothetical protein BD289DRAFT_159269 [Coniella lustricola]|uniref:Uncharacterized protein n=1 Tax=Coniella lustricola TaxID=2025994 RepID=A0A2T3AEJ5_9PEZI|nr:hypothetical protein BD289DRAFT_159269 [Coniella lustricola]
MPARSQPTTSLGTTVIFSGEPHQRTQTAMRLRGGDGRCYEDEGESGRNLEICTNITGASSDDDVLAWLIDSSEEAHSEKKRQMRERSRTWSPTPTTGHNDSSICREEEDDNYKIVDDDIVTVDTKWQFLDLHGHQVYSLEDQAGIDARRRLQTWWQHTRERFADIKKLRHHLVRLSMQEWHLCHTKLKGWRLPTKPWRRPRMSTNKWVLRWHQPGSHPTKISTS